MTDREKVIKGLEILINGCEYIHCDDCCFYISTKPLRCGLREEQIKEDALSLLKEQEARVMTLDQLEDALDTVVWLETPVSENLADGYSLIMAYSHKYGYMVFDSPFGDNPSQDRLEYSEYGRSWRCWDRRPSEEKRKVVKWE